MAKGSPIVSKRKPDAIDVILSGDNPTETKMLELAAYTARMSEQAHREIYKLRGQRTSRGAIAVCLGMIYYTVLMASAAILISMLLLKGCEDSTEEWRKDLEAEIEQMQQDADEGTEEPAAELPPQPDWWQDPD